MTEIFSNSDKTVEDNKTGSWRTFRPNIVKEKCTGCGICVNFCPDGCLMLVDRKDSKSKFPKIAHVDYDYCKGCLVCLNECPFKAITSEKEEPKRCGVCEKR
ncbi:MAG: 4Fe-4S binding protein [Candidatus Aenigmatarchaeota archaeon]